MSANHDPMAQIDFEAFSQFPKPNFDYSIETWKDYAAPVLRKSGDQLKLFDTMNARTELFPAEEMASAPAPVPLRRRKPKPENAESLL